MTLLMIDCATGSHSPVSQTCCTMANTRSMKTLGTVCTTALITMHTITAGSSAG